MQVVLSVEENALTRVFVGGFTGFQKPGRFTELIIIQSRFMDFNKAAMTRLITSIYMFILIYIYLPEVDLGKGQSCPKPCFGKVLGYLTYAVIALLSVFFIST